MLQSSSESVSHPSSPPSAAWAFAYSSVTSGRLSSFPLLSPASAASASCSSSESVCQSFSSLSSLPPSASLVSSACAAASGYYLYLAFYEAFLVGLFLGMAPPIISANSRIISYCSAADGFPPLEPFLPPAFISFIISSCRIFWNIS